ncbi:MAG: gamma carbonic anhydrase family protein [Gammaproteobacteria bacterium]
MSVRSYRDKHPRLAHGVFVHDLAVVIGDVTAGEDASFWPGVVARGDVHSIRIGARTNIQDGTVLHVTQAEQPGEPGYPLVIGDEVTVGHRAVVHGCTVGNRVLIGIGAVVLDGATIDDEVIVGAGSVVAPGKHLESGYLYLGAPARRARPLTAEELAGIDAACRHYVELKEHYKAGDGG